MPSYDQTPGTLNLAFNAGDDFAALVDFSIDMTGYSVSAAITSLVTGAVVMPLSTAFLSASDGRVNVSLTDSQTASLPRGTYGWEISWTINGVTRTALAGCVEVI